MENQTKKTNTSVTLGLILGFILALISVYGYAINNAVYFSLWTLVIMFLIPIVFGIISAVKAKKEGGGFISLKNALKNFILTISLGFLISSAVSILIFNVVDPDFKEVVKQIQVDGYEKIKENTISGMYERNSPESSIEKAEKNFDKTIEKIKSDDSYGVSKQLQGLLMMIAIYSILGLIVAAIIKKKDVD